MKLLHEQVVLNTFGHPMVKVLNPSHHGMLVEIEVTLMREEKGQFGMWNLGKKLCCG